MIGIQIISLGFALVLLFFTYGNYRRKDFNLTECIAWSILWLSFSFVSLFPQFFSPYVKSLGFSRLMDFVVVIGFVVIFAVLLHNYTVIRRLKRQLEKLVRKIALEDIDDK